MTWQFSLKTDTKPEMIAALKSAGAVPDPDTGALSLTGCDIALIGTLRERTGEMIGEGEDAYPEMQDLPGYHANIAGNLTQDQIDALPLVYPDNPKSGFAGLSHYTPEAAQTADDATRVLDRPQFAYLLRLTGLKAVWAQIDAAADVQTGAMLDGYAVQDSYRLSATIALLASLKPLTDAVAPDVDLSPDAIRAAWALAENVDF